MERGRRRYVVSAARGLWLAAALLGTPAVGLAQEAPAAASDLEARLRELEERNRRLATQLEASELRHQQQMELLLQEMQALRSAVAPAPPAAAGPTAPATGAAAEPSAEARRQAGVPTYRTVDRAPDAEARRPLRGTFGPGFEFQTEDGEATLQIHQETQIDYRAFDPTGEEFARSAFYLPRARIFFTGRVSKPWEYMFAINQGFANNFTVFDAWLNYRPDDRLQFKIGRFMSPFNYEQFAISNMWLIAPERSLFTSNLGLNRMLGAQFWGFLFDKRLDYALGVFDGPRNSFEDFNDAKDVMGYLNLRPFQDRDGSLFEFLNLGGSFTYGMQDNPLVPASWRVATNASNAGTADRAAPPFYVFNRGVEERGDRTFWSAHVAYFYKQLSLLADYNGAILRYAPSNDAPASFVIPTHGFSVAAGYFLTGEEVERRTIVLPRRDFDLRRNRFGLGAWELVGRYTTLNFDRDILSPELTDPNLWSHEAWVTNLGLNWYPNRYFKVYLDWQHADFGRPVAYDIEPLRRSRTNDLFWLRVQFYF